MKTNTSNESIAKNTNSLFNSSNIAPAPWKCVCKNQCLLCMISEGGKEREIAYSSPTDEELSFSAIVSPSECLETGVTMKLTPGKKGIVGTTEITDLKQIPALFDLQIPDEQLLVEGIRYSVLKAVFDSKDEEKKKDILAKMNTHFEIREELQRFSNENDQDEWQGLGMMFS